MTAPEAFAKLDTGVGFEVLTSKEFDKALSKEMTYRPPGG